MKHKLLLLLVPVIGLSLSASAQTIPAKQDPTIEKMVSEVSAQNVEAIVRKLVSFKTRHTMSDTTSATSGIGAARNWIKSEMEKYAAASGGRMKVAFQTFTQPTGGRISQPTVLKNVVATLKGTDPNDTRIYIVSGHYDSMVKDVMDPKADAPGAVDDASGTAVSMEICRVMAKRSFPATIIFMCVPGEEQGLMGSAYAAKTAREQNWNVDAMLNNDIVGNTHGLDNNLHDDTHIRVFSEGIPSTDLTQRGDTTGARRITTAINSLVTNGGENDAPSRQLARYIKETAERYVKNLDVKLIYRRDRYLRGGDHTSFQLNGFTAVRFTEMNEDFNRQHQYIHAENGVEYGDVPDHADYPFIQKAARMNLSVLANLATAPAAPANVVLVNASLTNKTTLRWEEPKTGKKPAGYNILMRETTSAFWEKKTFVTGTETVLNFSKDNYFFALQSVDAEGHESLPIFPKAGR